MHFTQEAQFGDRRLDGCEYMCTSLRKSSLEIGTQWSPSICVLHSGG